MIRSDPASPTVWLPVTPESNSPQEIAIKDALSKGEPYRFAPEDSDEVRTVQANWVRDAAVEGRLINIENAIITGALSFKYLCLECEVRFVRCHFIDRVDFSYATFRRNVILDKSEFSEGLMFDSAVIDYDLFMSDMQSSGEFGTVDLRDTRIGGSLFGNSSHFRGPVECQNLHVGNDVFFRGATFNGSSNFSDLKCSGALFFGYYPREEAKAAEFNSKVDFYQIDVGGNADFEEVKFNDVSSTAHFNRARVAGELMLSGAVFRGPVTFAHAIVTGQTRFHGTTFKSKATFSGLKIGRSALFGADQNRNLPASVFEYAARFIDMEVGSNIDFTGARFTCDESDIEVRFDRSTVRGNLRCANGVFRPKLVLASVQVLGQLVFDSSEFKNGLACFGMKVAGTAFFRNAVMNSDATFRGARFGSDVRFEASRFQGQVSFVGAGIDGDACFSSRTDDQNAAASFNSTVDFTDAVVHGNGYFSFANFSAEATFDSLHVEKSAFFEKSIFKSSAEFTGIRIGQDAIFDGVQFLRAGPSSTSQARIATEQQAADRISVTFQAAEIGGDAYFGRGRFEVDTSFEDCSFHGGAFFDSALFKKGSRPSFSGAHFQHGVFFSNTSFRDRANFRVARFGLEARFQGTRFYRRAIFDGANFEGIAEFRSGELSGKAIPAAIFNDVSFEHARFQQDARFDDSRFRKLAGFRETSFKALYLCPHATTGKPTRTQFKAGIDLRGCQYDRVQTNWQELLQRRGRNRTFLGRLRLPFGQHITARQEPYDRQPYIQLEKTLRASGKAEDADRVYLERRRVERKAKWQQHQFGRWLTDAAFGVGARYGVRPLRLVTFSVALLALGAWFFSHPNTLLPSKSDDVASGCRANADVYRAFAVSLHLFLPVEIPMGADCVPAPAPVMVELSAHPTTVSRLQRFGVYFVLRRRDLSVSPATFASLVLRLPGWILVPLGVASLAGVLRRAST